MYQIVSHIKLLKEEEGLVNHKCQSLWDSEMERLISFVQGWGFLTFAKAINTLRKYCKKNLIQDVWWNSGHNSSRCIFLERQSATPGDCRGEVKANLENQPKEQHNIVHYHQHCTLNHEASHHYNQQYLHMISCILRYLCENWAGMHCVITVLSPTAVLMLSSYLLWFCSHSTSFQQKK